MSSPDSTTKARPAKPNADFPLYAHSSGRWAKKIRGKTYFFGPWRDPEGALRRYLAAKDDLRAGRQHRQEMTTLPVAQTKPDSTLVPSPAKPYPGFPLYAHKTGRWAKKIRGKTHLFGPLADWQAALATYLAQKDDLEAGRRPKQTNEDADALTVQQMVAAFLNARRLDVENGGLALRTWKEYEDYGERMIRVFGATAVVQDLGPDDFLRLKTDLVKTHKSLASLRGDLRKIKVFFNWAGPGDKGKDLYHRPLRFGPDFQAPSSKAIKRQLDQQPSKIFPRKHLRRLLAKAGPKLRAMILLGINCGLGNTDCACLTRDRINLKTGWLHYPRPKTGVDRRCPLWPETLEAVRKVWDARKRPRNRAYARHVFLTGRRQPFDGTDISHEFRKLAERAKVNCRRFYGLRHTFATVASRSNLLKAVRTILGHQPPVGDMLGTVYDHGNASKSDLQAVVNVVHAWLFPAGSTSPPASELSESRADALLAQPESTPATS